MSSLAISGGAERAREWPFRTDLTVLLLIAAQPLELMFPAESGLSSPTKLTALLCFTTFWLDVVSTRREISFDATHAMLLGILAIALASSVLSRLPAEAFPTVLRYAGFVGLYVVITQFAHQPRLLLRMAWALSAACSVTAILAIDNFLADRTLLATPTYADPNDFAYLLATSLPITVWLWLRAPRVRLLAAGMVVVMLGGIALSLSRGAVLATAVGAVWLMLTEPRSRKPLAFAVCALALSVGLFVAQNDERLGTALAAKGKVAEANIGTRVELWRAATILIGRYPLLGVGPGNFAAHELEVNDQPQGFDTFVVHNAYLDVAAELGVVAAVLFILFLLIQVHRSSRAIGRADPSDFAIAVRVALVMAIVGAMTLSEQYFAPFWMLSGLATVLWRSSDASDRSARARAVRLVE